MERLGHFACNISEKVVISGPGIQGEVTVKERALRDGLGPEQFVDFAQRLSPAPQLGEGFRLTRYTPMEGSSEQFVDHLRRRGRTG